MVVLPALVTAVIFTLTLLFPESREPVHNMNCHITICASLTGTRNLTHMASVYAYQNSQRLGTSLFRVCTQNHLLYYCLLMLAAGDVKANPGPRTPKFSCGDCGKAVT